MNGQITICALNSAGRVLALLSKLFGFVIYYIMNTKQIGNLVELQCATILYELGCSVSIPFGNSNKYDLIIDWNDKLYKIQCKHSKEFLTDKGSPDYISFSCQWQSHNMTNGYSKQKYLANEIDYFATYYNGKCYLIPQNECSTQKILRINPPKNNQTKGVSFLKDYEASEVLQTL